MKELTIYMADDHTLFRKAVINLLETFPDVKEVKGASNGKELIALVKQKTPDVTIVDLQMPIMDGAATCEYIISKYPDVKLIVLTMHDNERFILHMMELGVHAFLLKNTEPKEFEKAILAVIENDFYHNELVSTILRKNVRLKHPNKPLFGKVELTDREREILLLICNELTIREIGVQLSLSENTVRNHRVNIMEKVGVKNVVGLVKYAYESGLLGQ